MKKTIAVCLAALFVLLAFVLPVSAAEAANCSASFTSHLGGLSVADFRQFADLSGGNLVFHTEEDDERTMVCDCTGDLYFEKMIPGRTYTVLFEFAPASGYEFADEVTMKDVHFTCEEGGEIVWAYLVQGSKEEKYLYVCEEVCIPGTLWQRIIGRIADWILKIRAWSLY